MPDPEPDTNIDEIVDFLLPESLLNFLQNTAIECLNRGYIDAQQHADINRCHLELQEIFSTVDTSRLRDVVSRLEKPDVGWRI